MVGYGNVRKQWKVLNEAYGGSDRLQQPLPNGKDPDCAGGKPDDTIVSDGVWLIKQGGIHAEVWSGILRNVLVGSRWLR